MAKSCYCVDASSLLKLKQDFRRVVFATVWQRTEEIIKNQRLFCPVEVLREIENDRELAPWAKKRSDMFRKLDSEQWAIAMRVTKQFPELANPGKFAPAADPFVIALAIHHNQSPASTLYHEASECIVVTEERGGPQRIPAACSHFQVKCVDLVGMFELEHWEF
jgi:hypothetical protein